MPPPHPSEVARARPPTAEQRHARAAPRGVLVWRVPPEEGAPPPAGSRHHQRDPALLPLPLPPPPSPPLPRDSPASREGAQRCSPALDAAREGRPGALAGGALLGGPGETPPRAQASPSLVPRPDEAEAPQRDSQPHHDGAGGARRAQAASPRAHPDLPGSGRVRRLPPPRRRRHNSRPPAVNAFPVGRRRRRSIRARGDPRPSVRRGRLPLLPRRRSASHARAIRSSALAPRGRKGEVTFPPPSIPPLLRPPPPPPPPRVAAPWRAVVAWRRRPRMERARRPGQVAQKLSQALPLCRLDDPPWPNPDEELRHRAERHRKGPKGHRVGSLLLPLRHPRRHETLPAVRPSSTKPRGSRLRRTTATPRRHPPRVKT